MQINIATNLELWKLYVPIYWFLQFDNNPVVIFIHLCQL